MVNTELLNLKIKESGLKKSQLCKAIRRFALRETMHLLSRHKK